MMNFFGKKKTTADPNVSSSVSATPQIKADDPQQTIVKLRENIDAQDKREEHIQKRMDSTVTEAKAKLAKGDKKGALALMKRKKLFEAELDKILNIKMTLETQVLNLESAASTAATFKAMEAGTKTMKKLRTDVGLDKVDDIMDEIREEMELAQEINNAMSQPVDTLLADEDELMAELNALETSDLEAELLAPPTKSATMSAAHIDAQLPTVPQAKLPALAQKEADDLRELEAELAGL